MQAEDLFHALSQAQSTFVDWIVLGSINLEEFVEQHCHQVSDWERNFRALKARGREAEKLPKYAVFLFVCGVMFYELQCCPSGLHHCIYSTGQGNHR